MSDIECGTITGYWRHYNTGNKPCDDCREAKRLELVARGEARPSRHCECGRRMHNHTKDRCYVCRTRRKEQPKPKTIPADIVWEKDHAGVFRAVTVIDPQPDGPRRGVA